MKSSWQYFVIILVVLLLFGAPKLPGTAKSLGQSLRVFRKEVKGLEEDKAADQTRAAETPEKPKSTDDSSAKSE